MPSLEIEQFQVALKGKYSNLGSLGQSAFYDIDLFTVLGFTSGVGAGQADIYCDGLRNVGISTFEDLDLAGGSQLVDAFGVARTFVKVKGIFVIADPGNTNEVVVGGAAANAFIGSFNAAADKVKLKPGAPWVGAFDPLGLGYTVTPGTGDLFRVANGGAGSSVNYRIGIWGTSA